jgi:hypothetical protein
MIIAGPAPSRRTSYLDLQLPALTETLKVARLRTGPLKAKVGREASGNVTSGPAFHGLRSRPIPHYHSSCWGERGEGGLQASRES